MRPERITKLKRVGIWAVAIYALFILVIALATPEGLAALTARDLLLSFFIVLGFTALLDTIGWLKLPSGSKT